jgi:predicted  nucleic acid-binding Zn-ribbon protein
METPSVKNCKSHIELHKINISKLDQESKKLSTMIDQVMDKAQEWEKKAKEAEKTMPATAVGKVREKMAAAEKSLDKLLNATIKVNESIAKAWEMQKGFEDTITNLSKNVAEWTKYVDVATGLVVDIGIGVGDASVAIESAANVLIAVSADAVLAAAG